jgi:hypothetical protein
MSTSLHHHFIPFSRRQVVDMILDEARKRDGAPDEERFRLLARLVRGIFHFQFHERVEVLKEQFALLCADGAHGGRGVADAAEPDAVTEEGIRSFETGLQHVLEKGNYEAISQADLARAFEESSLIPLRVEVDQGSYERLLLYSRGESAQTVRIKRWFGLRTIRPSVASYDRVCLYIRFQRGESGASPALESDFTSPVTLKLFRNIPKADLEMLLPNCRTRMRRVDKLLILVPALFGGVPVFVKIAPLFVLLAVVLGLTQHPIDNASLTAGLIGAITLGAYLFQRWENFKSRKLNFAKTLSENLYFRNLDNNEGVLTRLVDEAEEEECKEALLGYAFLAWSTEPITADALDRSIEEWLRDTHRVALDFEVADALDKLEKLEIVQRAGGGLLEALPLAEAVGKLRQRWVDLI